MTVQSQLRNLERMLEHDSNERRRGRAQTQAKAQGISLLRAPLARRTSPCAAASTPPLSTRRHSPLTRYLSPMRAPAANPCAC